ncbi:hypothetical protein BU074_11670 [Mammaliicoccus vitulinus]|uniref:hypothetical protein n=1 Tax=Mammaliicoccus vitulinus TaxID=71237 RepID=UPI000D1FC186|nr:hypothetical protein [Mammaliicoccus vitulinus]PTI36094.1 hypothetical protein BU074_11670 [Mammaliicoccus vitulinus]
MLKIYRKENKDLLLLDEVDFYDEAHDVIFEDIEDRGITSDTQVENAQFNDYTITGEEEE